MQVLLARLKVEIALARLMSVFSLTVRSGPLLDLLRLFYE